MLAPVAPHLVLPRPCATQSTRRFPDRIAAQSRAPAAGAGGSRVASASLACSVAAAASRRQRQGRRRQPLISPAAGEAATAGEVPPPPGLGTAEGRWWLWQGRHRIRYVTQGSGPPVVLVHGFGASVDYYRKIFPVLVAEGYTVYALDLLGLGLSDKPPEETYGIDLWAGLLQDFLVSVVPASVAAPVLVGNSIGSLVSVTVAAGDWGRSGKVRGLVLLNCAGGMNTRHMVEDDITPAPFKFVASIIQGVLGAVLGNRDFARTFFENVRTPNNVRETLRGIYTNKQQVDDELVSSILAPADDPNALDVFVKILTGAPGRSPDKLMSSVTCPVRLVWGDEDNFTPLDGPYGQFFQQLAEERPDVSLRMVPAGHCPHDDDAEAVHAEVLPWLSELPLPA